jgi:hypothetical protein
LIKEVLPWTSAVAKPPNWDRSYTECFGFTLEDLGEAGATSIEQRLRAVGLPVDTIPGFPMPMDLPPRERAVRGQKLPARRAHRAGDEGVTRDPEAIEIMFDTIRRGAITDGVRPGTTIAWDFPTRAPGTSSSTTEARGRCRARGEGRPDVARALRRLGRCDGRRAIRERSCCGGDCGRRGVRGCCWRCRRCSAEGGRPRCAWRRCAARASREGEPPARAEGANQYELCPVSEHKPNWLALSASASG